MRPVVSALNRDYQDRVEFIAVDVNTADGLQLARQYRVTATPTYMYLAGDGNVQSSMLGRQDQTDMEAALDALLAVD